MSRASDMPKPWLPWLIGAGAIAGLSVQTLVVSISLLFGLVALTFPELGALIAITAKPILDCFWESRSNYWIFGELNPQSVMGLVVPIGILFGMLRSGVIRIGGPVQILILLYCASIAAAALYSPLGRSAFVAAARLILPFTFIWAGGLFAGDRRKLVLLGVCLCFYGLVPVLTGVLQLANLIAIPEGGEPMPSGLYRISGLYYHPLDLAVRCSMALPFAWYLSRLFPDTARIAAWSWAIMLFLIAAATLVRSALIATALQMTGILWRVKHRAALIGSAFAIVVGVVTIPALRDVVSRAVRPLEEGNLYELGTGRGVLFAAQVLGFLNATPVEKGLGRGLASTPSVIVEYSPLPLPGLERALEEGRGMTSHNQLLRVLTETGILGALLLAAILTCVAWMTWGVARDALRPIHERYFAEATFIALVAVGVYGITTVPLDSPPITWPLWTMVGAVIAMRRAGGLSRKTV